MAAVVVCSHNTVNQMHLSWVNKTAGELNLNPVFSEQRVTGLLSLFTGNSFIIREVWEGYIYGKTSRNYFESKDGAQL